MSSIEVKVRPQISRTLERQIKKTLGNHALDDESLFALMEAVQQTYHGYEDSLKMMERSMELSSMELIENNNSLREQKKRLEDAYEELSAAQNQLEESERLLNLSQQLNKAFDRLHAAQKHASRLQMALLGNKEQISKYFDNAFIYHKPLDIVSGDFFWFSEKEDYGTHYKFMVAADCTGHGVPAAFMTILGVNFLNQIVNDRHIHEPDRILYELNKRIIYTLERGNTDSDLPLTDGMDLAIVTIDETENKLYFAGIKNSLWLVRNKEFIEIKGSKGILGKSNMLPKFEKHVVEIQEGDMFYLTTDGYADQFNAENKTKYMRKRQKDFMVSIHEKSMQEQLEALDHEHINWRGETRQTDDILVIGFKL